MTDSVADDMMAARPKQAGNVVARNGRPRANAGNALNQPVKLEGLAQVVGLALGSPEFQRR
jgi:hypothetical protein